MKCIYCLENKSAESFTKAEHVIPQSFGLFQDNFTLNRPSNKAVCDECNQYFGNNLEIDLGRDTLEGISRYEYGVQNPKDFKSLGKRSRFRTQVAEGTLKGVVSYLTYSKELNTVVCKPLPQVGFFNKTSASYKYFLLGEIPSKVELEAQGFDCNNRVRAFGDSFEKVMQALVDKEISPEFQEETAFVEGESDKWLFESEGSIDKTVCRAIAKIAFNYLAYWQSADFVLQRVFDPIRTFIRNGEQGDSPFLMVRDKNILVDEPSEKLRRIIHIVTLNWAQNGEAIISQISLFNFLSYTVQLAKSYSGQIPNLRKGHFFNLNDHKIYEFTAK